MGFPINDIALSNKPVAFLISVHNTLKIIKLKKIKHGFFVDMEFGVFIIDSTNSVPLQYGKQTIYIYDVRSAKPLNLLMMKELDAFVKDNGLAKITPKHVRQGEKLRMLGKKHKDNGELAFNELKEDEDKLQDDITKELNKINITLEEENDKLLKDGKQALEITPEDYAGFIVERLTGKGLITRDEATAIKSKLSSGAITLDDFAKELEDIHKIEINRPISTNAQNYLEHYKTYKPADVLNYIIEAIGLGKDIKDLGQPIIRNLLPIKWIVLGMIGFAIAAIVISSIDWNTIKNLIPFFNK